MLLAVVVVISLRAVGTVMAVTMLVTPPATARLAGAQRCAQMTLWGVAFGVGEGVVGLMISYHLSSAPGPPSGSSPAAVFAVVFAITLPRRMPHHHRPLWADLRCRGSGGRRFWCMM